MSSLTYRYYQKGDELEILSLYRETFGQVIDPKYWEWKYLKNPSGKIYLSLAFDQDKCVGQYAMLPLSLCDYGYEIETLVALDNMVHPQYQRRGILQQLEQLLIARGMPTKIPYYTFLNEKSFDVYTKKFGWKYIGETAVYMKPTSMNSLAKRNPLWWIGQPLILIYQRFYRNSSNPIQALPFDEFDSEIDQIWQKNKAILGVTFNRSREYLEWRFNKSPLIYYKYKLVDNGELAGFAVVRIQEKFGLTLGWVLDIFLDQSRDALQYQDALLAIQEKIDGCCDFISVLLPTIKYQKAIMAAGFRKVPRKLLPHLFYFCVKPNGYPYPKMLEIENWYLSWSLHDTL